MIEAPLNCMVKVPRCQVHTTYMNLEFLLMNMVELGSTCKRAKQYLKSLQLTKPGPTTRSIKSRVWMKAGVQHSAPRACYAMLCNMLCYL
jgi:hypothetical protein